MNKKLWLYIVSVSKHWGSLVTGGVIIGVIGIWQNTGHPVPVWAYWLVAIVAFFIGSFNAWSEQVEHAEILQKELDNPSKLVLSQKQDPGFYDVKRLDNGTFFIYATLIISNQGNKANAVVRYEASIMKTDMSYVPVTIEQGDAGSFKFSVTPVNVPALNTVEAAVGFFDFAPQRYGQPFKMKITAIDMYDEEFTTDIDFAKPTRA
jgi:hypothetical protein